VLLLICLSFACHAQDQSDKVTGVDFSAVYNSMSKDNETDANNRAKKKMGGRMPYTDGEKNTRL